VCSSDLGVEVSRESSYSFTVTEDVELVANFDIFEVILTANPPEGGTVLGGGTFEYGEGIIVTAITYPGYKFVNWTKDGEEVSTNSQYNFFVTEDVELVANFEKETGIVETDNYPFLRVYPNPTTGMIFIETASDIKVYNLQGALLQEVFGKQVDLSAAPQGVYILQINGRHAKVVRR
jgi:hypothetical protein